MKILKSWIMIIAAASIIITSCKKDEVTNIKSVSHIKTLKIYDNSNNNYAEITLKSTDKTVLANYEKAFSNLTLVYEEMSSKLNEIDPRESEFYTKPDQLILNKTLSKKSIEIYCDFSQALERLKQKNNKSIKFSFVAESQDRQTVVVNILQGAAPVVYSSPDADGFSIDNISNRAQFQVFSYPSVIELTFNLSAGSSISAPYFPPLEDKIYGIIGSDITWPYQNILAVTGFYYQ